MTAIDKAILKELQMQIARLKPWFVPTLIFLMAAGILVTIIANWDSWTSERAEQETDDAYVPADLTRLSTTLSGVAATLRVADYHAVQAGALLVPVRHHSSE